MELELVVKEILDDIEKRAGYARLRGEYFREDRDYWRGYEDALDYARRLFISKMEVIE